MYFSFIGRDINTINFMVCSLITYTEMYHYRAMLSTFLGDKSRGEEMQK